MKAEEINNLLVDAGSPTLGTEVYYGIGINDRIRCTIVGVYHSETAKGFMPIIRAINMSHILRESAAFNNAENMIFPEDAMTVERSRRNIGDKPVFNDEFLPVAEHIKEVDKRIVEGLARLNLKIGDVIEVEIKDDHLRWDFPPTEDLSLPRKRLTIIGFDKTNNPVVAYDKGWDTKTKGIDKIHSSCEKELKGWSINKAAIVTNEMKAKKVDADIIKRLETTRFKLGQKVYISRFSAEKELPRDAWLEVQYANKNNYGDKKDYLEGTIAGYDGSHLIIKNDEKLGRFAEDVGFYYGNPIHSSAAGSASNYVIATPAATKTEEDFQQTVKVNGSIYQIGTKMFACQLNTGLSKSLYTHNDYKVYAKLVKEHPSINMDMVQVSVIGKKDEQLIVDYNGRKEYINTDALYSSKTLPAKVSDVEKARKLHEKGFDVGGLCKFVSANRHFNFIPRPRMFGESDEQYGEYFDSIGCELIWQTGTIKSVDFDIVEVEFFDIEGNKVSDKIPLSQIGNLFGQPSEGFTKVMDRQKLKKLGLKIGDKRKVLAFNAGGGTWRNNVFASYVNHLQKNNEKPGWVEVEISGVDVFGNVAFGKDATMGVDSKALFDLDADFPEAVKKAFPTPPVNAFMSKVKLEGTSAGYRIASMQLTAMVRRAIITLLQKSNNSKVQMISSALDTEIGKAIVGGAIGVLLLQYYPSDKRAQRLAEEFRINALATVGNEAVEALMGEMLPALINTFSSLPNEERIQILKETTTEFSGIFSEPEEENHIKEKIANG